TPNGSINLYVTPSGIYTELVNGAVTEDINNLTAEIYCNRNRFRLM
ncbi:MAG: hypothetical protein IPL08_12150, partial [Saprospiraceae bacterium]|nr:hypothetical protein [Saprospiraceae bacterium]